MCDDAFSTLPDCVARCGHDRVQQETDQIEALMAQAFNVQPVDASFGAVITGVRLPDLDQATWKALHDSWLEYALLIFPGQHLKKDEQIAFAKRFGPLEFEMGAVSNVREDGTLRVEVDPGDDVV